VCSLCPWRDRNGFVNVLSRHTTTAVTINEMEGRLVDDVRQYLVRTCKITVWFNAGVLCDDDADRDRSKPCA
jgi:thiamine phosphate synthase YjbQ (UPF0047 family)